MGAGEPDLLVLPEGTLLAVLDALPLAVVVVDRDGRALYANRLAERLLGDQLALGSTLPWAADDQQPADAGSAEEARVGGFAWGSVHATAAVVRSATGGLLRPMKVAVGDGQELALVVLSAVSSQTESYLGRDPAEQLREVEAIARLGSWTWDIDANVMSWSDESYRLFGLAPQAAPANFEEIRRCMHPENRRQSEKAIERCRQTGEGFGYTRRVVLPDGRVRWHRGRAEAVLAGKRVVRMFGVVQDVTEQVRTEHELRDSLQRARELTDENESLRAEIEAQLDEVHASRARIVRAADRARRRLERDLHDGAQQRLTTAGLILGTARASLDAGADPELRRALDEASEELQAGLSELRSIARGLHPPLLTDAGLVPALQALVSHSPVPVELHAAPLGRLPGTVETAAYFVVAEALTNVSRHATAASAGVNVEQVDDVLIVEVRDDGSGGAGIESGTGLLGLSDRIAALNGRLELHSPEHGGTRLRVELPCA